MLLQAAHNYLERGLLVYLLTAKLDNRDGEGRISSRIGLGKDADTFDTDDDLYARLGNHVAETECACVFVDEAQFLSKEQVWQLARFVDDYNLPVMCYGLRVDAFGELFPGSSALLALADEMREVRTICWCGKKAGMVVRRDSTGRAIRPGEGEQIQIGGNDVYVALCRRHWRAEVGDAPPVMPKKAGRKLSEPLVGKAHPGEATPPAARTRPGAVDLVEAQEEGGMLAVACDGQDGGSESPK
jgi:thymidine kinase